MENDYEIRGDITAILINGKGKTLETLIDTNDLDLVKSFDGRFYGRYNQKTDSFYVMGNSKMLNYQYKRIQLHRFITNAPKGKMVDHINHDTLDNRKSNLRLVNNSQNMQNRSGNQRNNTSGFRGVSFHKGTGRWFAYVWVNGKRISLGLHKDINIAAEIAKRGRELYMPYCNEKEVKK